MPTQFNVNEGGISSTSYTVNEDTSEVVDEVNAALDNNLKFVTFTKQDDGKRVAVPAKDIYDIREV